MRNLITLFTPIFLLLIGCAGITPIVPPTAQPEVNAAYIAGLFSRTKGFNFAFVIRSADGKNEYVMPMGEDSSLPTQISQNTIAVKVPPGTYSVSEWISYATLTKAVSTRKAIPREFFSGPFIVRAGSVTHLGSFAIGSSDWHLNGAMHEIQFDMRIQPLRATSNEARDAFTHAYPNLASQSFSCPFCADASPPAGP